MIPAELAKKGEPIGNTAGMGAAVELLHMPYRNKSREIAAAELARRVRISHYHHAHGTLERTSFMKTALSPQLW